MDLPKMFKAKSATFCCSFPGCPCKVFVSSSFVPSRCRDCRHALSVHITEVSGIKKCKFRGCVGPAIQDGYCNVHTQRNPLGIVDAITTGDLEWIGGYVKKHGVDILLDPSLGALRLAFTKNRASADYIVTLLHQVLLDMDEFLTIKQVDPKANPLTSPTGSADTSIKSPGNSPPGYAPKVLPTSDKLAEMATRIRAAQLIKRCMSRMLARVRARQLMVRKVWNELEKFEESELNLSNEAYERLKQQYQARKEGKSSAKTNWECRYDPASGNVYFRNVETGTTTWECPPEMMDGLSDEEKWTLHTDPSSGRVFFSNKITKEVTWKCPPELKHQDNTKVAFESKFLKRVLRAREELSAVTVAMPWADIVLGPDDPVDMSFFQSMLTAVQKGKSLRWSVVVEIATRAFPLLLHLDNVVDISTKHGASAGDTRRSRVVVVGDIHGQLDDLSMILHNYGLPTQLNQLLFNGDIVDRGNKSVECLLLLLTLKILAPDHVHINRGNHEAKDVNSRDGFERELKSKYGTNAIFDMMSDLLATLPLASVIDKKIFVVHAGLFSKDHVTLDQLQSYRRLHAVPPRDSIMEDMLWADPMERTKGREASNRGAGLKFGRDVAEAFLKENHLKMIIRSHECVDGGYQEFWGGKLYTVFSASNYCGEVGNWGAVVEFGQDLKPVFCRYSTLRPADSQISLPADQKLVDDKVQFKANKRTVLEDAVIRKLLARIAIHRLELGKAFEARLARIEDTTGAAGLLPKMLWSQVLKEVLKLHVPFLQFQKELVGHHNHYVDVRQWLSGFVPTHIQLTGKANSMSAEEGLTKLLGAVSQLMFQKKADMTSLFRYFDADSSGTITMAEFHDGIASLLTVLGMAEEYNEELVHKMLHLVDTNRDGEIQYEEFLAAFDVPTPASQTVPGKNCKF